MKTEGFKFLVFLLLSISLPFYSISQDCEVLRKVSRYVAQGYMVTQTDTIVIQVNNRNGEKYSDFKISYSSSTSRIDDIDGWVVDAAGEKVRKLKKNEIDEQNAFSSNDLYKDILVKSFQLRHNSYPYRVYYTYSITYTESTVLADWSPVFDADISTREAKLILKFPRNFKITKYLRDAQLVKADTSEKSIGLEFTSKYVSKNFDQKFALPFEDIKPRVVILSNKFYYGVEGSSDSWITFGNWFLNLNKDLLDIPDSEKRVIDDLLKDIKEPKEKIRALYHYMQDHVRYINVSIGIGGCKSYSASYVAQNKYGDCKALTTYMKALLNYAGIKAYYTLINASIQPVSVISELPTSQFNHVILCVPLQGDTIWLESTSSSGPFGYVSSYIQNRKALFVDENNSHLINMPKHSAKDDLVEQTIRLKCYSNGDAEVRATFRFKGYSFDLYNGVNSDFNKNDQDELVRGFIPFRNYELYSWKIEKTNRDSLFITLESKLKLSSYLSSLGSEFYFSTFPILDNSFDSPSKRSIPLQIPFPIYEVDSAYYQLADDLEIKKLPFPVNVKTEFGEYELSIKTNGDKFLIYKRLILFPATYSIERYKRFYDFIRQVKEAERKVVILTKKQ